MTDKTNTCGEGAEPKPLPCPFCGNPVDTQSFWYGAEPGEELRRYYVFCLECSDTDALGPRRDTLEEAVTAWNTRVVSPTQQAAKTGEGLKTVEPGWLAKSVRRAEIELAARRLLPDLMQAIRDGASEDGLRSTLTDPRALTAGEEAVAGAKLAKAMFGVDLVPAAPQPAKMPTREEMADLPNKHVPDHPDAYLNALLDYTKGFYSATREAGLPAKVCADAMQHVESAARGLHRKAMVAKTGEGVVKWADLEDEISDAIAALTPEPEGWRDIESAPKDGSLIHVWAAGYDWPETVRWELYDADCAEEAGEAGYWTYAESLISDATEDCGQDDWTHWRPLPAPPASAGGR